VEYNIINDVDRENLIQALNDLRIELQLVHAEKCGALVLKFQEVCDDKSINEMALLFNDIKVEIDNINTEFYHKVRKNIT
jgi:hypothetical protein